MSAHCVQEYLRKNGTEALQRELSINVAEHPELPLVALKYSQLNSPKLHPIVRECRGIVIARLKYEYAALEQAWNECRDIASQKDFALAVLPRTQFSSILFAIRKNGNDLQSEWRNSAELICRKLYGNHTETVERAAA